MTSWMDVWRKTNGPQSKKEFVVLYIKAFLMGVADLVPGVSGGTIAFITGIYPDFLQAIASLNRKVLKQLLKFQIKKALMLIHLRFIIPVLAGILSAIFLLAHLMNYLLKNHPVSTWAMFFGLIAASIVVVGCELKRPFKKETVFWCIAGMLFAYVIVGLIPLQTPQSWWFIFLCGAIGIMAMILPGISGSFLLLVLGKYEFIIGAVKDPFIPENMVIIGIFACGTISGLLTFGKFLNFLLKKHTTATMAFLTGILIGSMRKIWPWKEVVQSKVIHGKTRILQEINVIPQKFDGEFFLALILILTGLFTVLLLNRYARKKVVHR